ncbi:hypothetical protein [Crocosphaera chwakensis]|uniref:Uncharacterized protein n=1 Tax=Crocosphaera chwakensis CCY0110 TaxID=391612 RepID=A3IY32_9CHRO|nr:hypothetical protein [Crocosphaera chwakensis]EAZ88608.1 hypothetical protein CY0110_31425 [Crocosphaera chwakensis CCY0110]
MSTDLFPKITEMLSQLSQLQSDLIHLKQQIIEIEMSQETSQNVVNSSQSLPF